MTSFSFREAMTNRRADGGQLDHFHEHIIFKYRVISNMADVCEAFSFFRVFSGLMTNIRVHSCLFVVLQIFCTKLFQPLAIHAQLDPFIHLAGPKRFIEVETGRVPFQTAPFQPSPTILHGDFRQTFQQRLA